MSRLFKFKFVKLSQRNVSCQAMNLNLQSRKWNFINGTPVAPTGHKSFYLFEPSTGSILCQIDESSKSDVDAAVRAAQQAFKLWSRTSGLEKAEVLRNTGKLLRERSKELAVAETVDAGKPIWESKWDIQTAFDCFEYFAGLSPTISGQHIKLSGDNWAYTIRQPIGIVGAIGAWNYPIQIAAWKLAPALACGNTVVFKPSPLTPINTLTLAEILKEAGVPDGAVNVVQGQAATGQYMCEHPDVNKITFTGSVPVGKTISKIASESLKRVTLELGGKSPLIIFEDAVMKNAVNAALMGNFLSQGQVCNNATRVFVQESIYDQFVDMICEGVEKINVGNPHDEQTTMGALISEQHLDKVLSYVDSAAREGAVVVGGKRMKIGEGYFMEPCVLLNCRDDMKAVREEIFGPVMSVLKFCTEDEVLERANATKFGLAGGVFTENLARGHRVVAGLQGGVQWINNYNTFTVEVPFGGLKESGYGRENGLAAIEHFTELKTVLVESGDVWTPFD